MLSAPLDDGEFATLMEGLGPFESRPRIAVAVSGGSDSLALTILAHHWAHARGGRVEALTVDHGLRPESAAEAAQVARWLALRDIPHHVLEWRGDKPVTGVEAAARTARYALLEEWCAKAGVLHLLLAHHLDDQAETVLLRLARGSGVDGLAGMAWVIERRSLRLVRPLLEVPHERLTATLEAIGQPWVEDPTNRSDRFKRSRLRRLLAEEGIDSRRLAATARGLGRARQCLERSTADALVAAVSLEEAGYASMDMEVLRTFSDEIRLRALSAVCRTVGGGCYPPRLERLERLLTTLLDGLARRRTFAGCVLAPLRQRVLVCREAAAVAGPSRVENGGRTLWDGRFSLRVAGGPAIVAALGAEGWREIQDEVGTVRVPAAARLTLPALFDAEGVAAVPHLGFRRPGKKGPYAASIAFTPARALAPVRHCLV